MILCLRISSFYLTRHLKIGISLTYVEDIYDFEAIPWYLMFLCLPFPLLKGEKVDSSDLKSILGNLGIELTDKEKEKLLETLTIDGEPS